MPGYIYAQRQRGDLRESLRVERGVLQGRGKDISLSVESEMPWGGKSRITVSAEEEVERKHQTEDSRVGRNQPVPGDLYSYLDRWDEPASISVNGERAASAVDKFGYVSLNRNWKNGDVVEIEFPFEVRKVVANQKVKEDRGRMAVERGRSSIVPNGRIVTAGMCWDCCLIPRASSQPRLTEAFTAASPSIAAEARNISSPLSEPKPVKLIPYYLWANRGAGEMSVWLSKDGIRPRRYRPRRRPDLLCQPELRGRWLAVSGSRALRSERGRQMGLFPHPDTGCSRRRGGHGQAEYPGHAGRMQDARNGRRPVRELQLERLRRLVSAVARRTDPDVSST